MRFFGVFLSFVCMGLFVTQGAYAAAPTITTQPQPPSQSILAGSNVTYSVVASGTSPLTFQWSLNGTNLTDSTRITGATNTTLTISNLVASDTGSYHVVVSNRNGTATSSNVTLTVLVPATITGQPQSLTTNGGSTVTLSATVSGSTPLFYQWQFNGTNLPGATNLTLTLSNVLDNQSGAYDLVVSNTWGVATSSNATLTVIPWISPSISPNPITYGTGQLLIWALNTGGFSPNATYQWYQNGNNMGSFWDFTAPTEVGEWRNPPPSVAGDYFIVASDSLNTVTSSVVTLTVLVPATITTPPANQTVAVSNNVVFAAGVIGDAPVTYQWFFDGTPLSDGGRISGSTTATLNIASAQTNDAGSYELVVSNKLGSANATATLNVLFPPVITSQPTNQNVALGSNVTFNAAASGSSPLTFQWFFNGNALADGGQFSGSATPNLTVSNLQLTNAGNYTVVVTNLVGSATSAVATLSLHGVTRYVDLNSANPTSPYLNWSTAATNIQDAIDASTDGDLILVTNGLYQSTGRVVFGSMTNVVAITKAVTVQSVNGPAVTYIHNQYWWYYGYATRDVYMTNNSTLIGFTMNSGMTRSSGDTMKEESGGGIYCEDNSSVISNCVITGNSAWMNGGGVVGGTLYNCTLSGNAASKVASNGYGVGGGAVNSVLYNCLITGNSAERGGGAASSTLNYCTVSGNVATGPYDDYFIAWGGGLFGGVANNCKIVGNSAYVGGGMYGYSLPTGTLNNCLVASNSASYGGAIDSGVANNCTIAANSSGHTGASYSTLNNCIIYHNNGTNYDTNSVMNNCCTFPMPTNGVGNFTNDPIFVNTNEFHLMPNSPCIDAGSNAYVVGNFDLDGNARVVNSTVDVGAYEYQYLPIFIITQPANQTNTIGQSVSFNIIATGNPQLSYQWQFDGTNIPNATNTTLILTNIQLIQAGLYSVILSNSVTNLSSSSATLTVNFPAPVIVSQPTNVLIFAGSSVSFSASVLTYSTTTNQWMFNNTTPLIDDGRIVGSTTTNLTIANVTTNDAGTYSLVASNAYGSGSSAGATLTVYPLTAISFPQGNVNATGGSNVTITPVISGQAPFSYQWQFDGENLAGATNSVLTISNILDVQAGNYAIAVNNAAGTVVSSNVLVSVSNYVNATVWPGTVIAGSPGYASFWLNEGGFNTNAVYQWVHNGTNMGPSWAWTATNTTASFQPLMADAGTYYVFASDGIATATSTNEVLIVIPLAITTQPTNQSTLAGNNVTINSVVQGQSPVALQWQFDGTNILGATNASLVLTNVQMNQAGTYTLLASNQFTNLVSSNVMLTVAPLGITKQPTNYIAWPSGSASFQVTVAGQAPFTFDWRLNGNDLGAPSTNVLAVTNIQPWQFGNYDVVISNQYGSVTSSLASLIFSQVAVWGINSYGETNLTTGLSNIVAIAGGGPGSFDCVALKNNGTVVLWPGTLFSGKTNGVTNLIAIAGALPNYGLRSNGVVVEWYSDGAYPIGVSNTAAIAFGPSSYLLTLRTDGTLPQLQASSPSNVVAIAEGGGFSLMLKSDGTIAATGNNSYGQTTIPTGLSNVVAVAAGANHSLALKGNGTVVGWGYNGNGQVTIPFGLSNVVAIAAGANHSIALRANGTVVAWGNNANGQTNVPRNLTNVLAITGAPAFSMALIGTHPPTTHAPLSNPVLGTNGVSFSISSQSGHVYVLQYKNALTDSNWTSLLPLVPGTGSTITLRDATATNSGRFYRVQKW